jgi:hypothetical protein
MRAGGKAEGKGIGYVSELNQEQAIWENNGRYRMVKYK